ncbi:MAG: translation elongation factor-like protein [Armatimonadota bacterium]
MTAKQGAPEEKPIGQVSHYFGHAGVAAIELSATLSVGQRIHIRGHTTDFIADVQSMQIEHEQVSQAGPGASIGVKVSEKVRPGDMVYLAE